MVFKINFGIQDVDEKGNRKIIEWLPGISQILTGEKMKNYNFIHYADVLLLEKN
jgi:hypothetical protein